MITIKNTEFQIINEVFNVKLEKQFKIKLFLTFNFKNRIINKLFVQRKESQFKDSLQSLKNSFYIKLRALTEKRYVIFELKENVELKEFNFRNQFFEISGIMPETFIEHFQILAKLFEWAENLLEINSPDLNLKYYENDTIELKIPISKNIEELQRTLNKLSEIEKNNELKISILDWCNFEEFETVEIKLDFLNSLNLTAQIVNSIIKLINTGLFSEIKVYFKSNSVWISSPDIFKYNFSIPMNELFDNIDKYIKFFNMFKYNRFINLVAKIINSKEIEKYIKDYFFVFEKFENYLNEMNSLIELIKL